MGDIQLFDILMNKIHRLQYISAVGIGLQQLVLSFPDAAIFAECSQATECVTPGVYAMLGAAAALGGVEQARQQLCGRFGEATARPAVRADGG